MDNLIHISQQSVLLCFTASVVNDTSAMKLREKLYLLAVGYYRSGDYSKSRDCIEQCLEV